MGRDFNKGDISPLDRIKNLAHDSFIAKMEKAFATLQELIILKIETNESELIMPKKQFLELMTNAGFIMNSDEMGGFNLTKQIQFLIDREIRTMCHLEYDWDILGSKITSNGVYYLPKEATQLMFRW